MKKQLLMLAALLLATAAAAQDRGEDYFALGEIETAHKTVKEVTSTAATSYLAGEIAAAKGDAAAAKSFYEKGFAADPEFTLNQVGLAKLTLAKNKAEGTKLLTDIAKSKSGKKNAAVQTAIARAYYDNGMTAAGDVALDNAESADKNSPLPYILRGDRMLKANNPGGAAGQYEQALMKAPNDKVACIKIAQIYLHLNPSIAIERLRELAAKHPDSPMVKKYLAKGYFSAGMYERAIGEYQNIYDNSSDIDVLTSYAASLFFTDRFDKAAELTEKGLSIAPNNFVLTRLRMYSELAKQDYAAGLATAEKFFSIGGENDKYIARDYMTYGDLLLANGQSMEATAQYNKALEVPETPVTTIREVADKLNKDVPEVAASYYQRYIDSLGDKADATDYYTMGQSLYKAATIMSRDTTCTVETLEACLCKADDAFCTVTELIPESHLGPVFQARVNSLRDPEATAGLAKPFYEKTAEIILSKDDPSKNRRELVEAYRYLSYYYYVKFDASKQAADKAMTLEYCAKILELDPTNSTALQLQEALK